ncbi:MAG: hypothetical protein VW405_00550 [Rhodospirillaceae bacterium]
MRSRASATALIDLRLADGDVERPYGDAVPVRMAATQGLLLRLAEWSTGRAYAPDALRAAGKPLRGIVVSVEAERALRAVIDRIAAGDGAAAGVAKAALHGMLSSLSMAGSGGDSGAGQENRGAYGFFGSNAMYGPGTTLE